MRNLLAALIISVQLILPTNCMAEEVPSSQTPVTTSLVNLDLTSKDRSYSAVLPEGTASAALVAGTETRTVSAGDLLTPAEAVALNQVLNSGVQSIQLATNGTAQGGSFQIPSSLSAQALQSLVVPSGVNALHDFAGGALHFTGDLTNNGNLYAYSSSAGSTTASLSALNIINGSSGLISSALPATLLTGVDSAVANLNLSLSAVQNIINSGSIVSAGNLTMTAGNSIINALPAGQTGTLPSILAAGNLNLSALNILNSGTMSAQAGAINIAAANLNNQNLIQSLSSNINIVNSLSPDAGLSIEQSAGAALEALAGEIAVTTADPALKALMEIDGGSILAEDVRFNAGEGHLAVAVGDVADRVHVHAGTADFTVTDGSHALTMEEFVTTGDPNLDITTTSSYTSSGFVSDGGFVRVNTTGGGVSSHISFTGDIITTPSTGTGSGGFVELRSAASISVRNIDTSANGDGNGGDITIISGITNPGNIIITGQLTANADGTASGVNQKQGGNIYLESFGGSGSIGRIQASGPGSVTTGHLQSGPGGNVTLLADSSITIGEINTSATVSGDAGNITIASSRVAASDNLVVNGSLLAEGAGSGSGGDISITFSENSNDPIGIGSSSIGNRITGSVSANGGISGAGGSITIENSHTSPSTLTVNVFSPAGITATGTTLGNLTLSRPGKNLTLSGPGLLVASLTPVGNGLTVSVSGDNSLVEIPSMTGYLSVTLTGDNTMLTVPAGAVVNGQGVANTRLGAETIVIDGQVSTTTSQLLIDHGSDFTVTGSGSLITNGTFFPTIRLTSGGNNTTLGGTLQFDFGGTSNRQVDLFAGDTLSFLDGTNFQFTNTDTINMQAPNNTHLGNTTLSSNRATRIVLSPGGFASDMTITGTGGSTATFHTTGGVIDTYGYNEHDVIFQQQGTGTAAFSFEGASSLSAHFSNVFTVPPSDPTFTVGALVSVLSDSPIFISGTGAGLLVDVTSSLGSSRTGSPGLISFSSTRTGTVTIDPGGTIFANQSGGGNGGSFFVSATGATVNLGSGLVDLSATGAGNAAGGNMSVYGQTVNLTSGLLQVNADALGNQYGGNLSIIATTNDLTIGPSDLNFSSQGGSSAGTGGSILLSAARSVIVGSGNVFDISPGTNGAGGSFFLQALTQYSGGNLQFDGSINADGNGSGAGGSITINYGVPGSPLPLLVGATSAGSYISGNISASGSTGGTINMMSGFNQPLELSLAGSIAAAGTTPGTISFNSNQSVVVAGPGLLTGNIVASGTDINISPGAAGQELRPSHIQSNAGPILLAATGTGASIVVVPPPSAYPPGTPSVSAVGGDVTLDSWTITIDGDVTAEPGFSINLFSPADVVVTGAGQLSADFVNAVSSTGLVNIQVNDIQGVLSGQAATTFQAVLPGDLSAGSISALAGSLSLASTGGNVSVVGDSALDAFTDVLITGQTGVEVGESEGGPVSITAGRVDGAFDPLSTNMADYDFSGITSTGSVRIQSAAGDINVQDSVSIASRGGSIGLVASGNINFGAGNQLFAQGANVWLTAGGSISMLSGGSIIAIARTLPGGSLIPIGEVDLVPEFAGGSIGIFAGGLVPDIDDELLALQLGRVNKNSYLPGDGVTGDYLADITGGGYVELFKTGAGGIDVNNATLQSQGGVIFIDPPDGVVAISGMTFLAVAPEIFVPPPPASETGSTSGGETEAEIILTDVTSQSILDARSSTVIPTDITDSNKQLQQATNPIVMTDCRHWSMTRVQPRPGDEEAWLVASGACEPFVITGSDRSVVMSTGGTALKVPDARTVVLKDGKIVALPGRRGMLVRLDRGELSIPADAATIVEQVESRSIRIAHLAGTPVSFSATGEGSSSPVSAGAGEEIIIADSSLAREELIPADGVAREAVSGAVTFAGATLRRNKFSPAKMVESDSLLACRLDCLPVAIRRRIEGIRQDAGGDDLKISRSVQPQFDDSIPVLGKTRRLLSSIFTPVSYRPSPAQSLSTDSDLRTIFTKTAQLRHTGDAGISMESPQTVTLQNGTLLITTTSNTTVKCGDYMLSIDPGTTSLIRWSDEVLRIYNLSESARHAIRAHAGSRYVTIGAGQEVMLGLKEETVRHAMENDRLARRRIKMHTSGTEYRILRSEVSLVRLLQTEPVLASLGASHTRADRKLFSSIIKMAACLHAVTSYRGAYSHKSHLPDSN